MMKRLVEARLLAEFADENDRRVKRVRLTAKGHGVRERFLAEKIPDLNLKAGNLEDEEKGELIRLLGYLKKFHSDIYTNDNGASFEEMAEKYLLR